MNLLLDSISLSAFKPHRMSRRIGAVIRTVSVNMCVKAETIYHNKECLMMPRNFVLFAQRFTKSLYTYIKVICKDLFLNNLFFILT